MCFAKRMKIFIASAFLTLLFASCGGNSEVAQEGSKDEGIPPVAIMADVHFEDVYGDLKTEKFSGIPTSNGRNATIRTMYAQLTSTRLFNENYFAFLSALDDAYSRGIRLVALPGDYSDDGQPVNIEGLKAILTTYHKKGMRFFLAPGNHDPNSPFDDDEAGKNDFLTAEGKEQKIYGKGNAACQSRDSSVICTNQLMELGYEKLITQLGDFGFMPSKEDLYWETPFSRYTSGYNYQAAADSSAPQKRFYEVCKEGEGGTYKEEGEKKLGQPYTRCTHVIDSSYLVEPVKGVWLLSIDANVFIPNESFDPANPDFFKGFDAAGDAGWNKVVTHKKHLLAWMTSVADRAKAKGKVLVPFSHYPVMDFYANQTDAMKSVFKPGAFQMTRVPEPATTATIARTGIRFHAGGHMHFNGTNDYHGESGEYLASIQSPSLAVFGAAYKIVQFKEHDTIDVQTIGLNNVNRYNEFFKLYEREWDYLRNSALPSDTAKLWNKDILSVGSYGAFTRFYFGELSRLRFMDDYWPCEMKEAAMTLDARQMLILSQLQTKVTFAQLKDIPGVLPLTDSCMAQSATTNTSVAPSQLSSDWSDALARAEKLASAAGFRLDDFSRITPYEFDGDFHRTVYAGELALLEMGADRVGMYNLLMNAFPANPEPVIKIDGKMSNQNTVNAPFQNQFKQVFSIFRGLGSGKPSGHFSVDFKAQQLTNLDTNSASFN